MSNIDNNLNIPHSYIQLVQYIMQPNLISHADDYEDSDENVLIQQVLLESLGYM